MPSEALYIYCNRWSASCRVKESSDEWSHSEPGVSFRMGVEANNGSPNELFHYFLSTSACVPIRNWIAPNGSNCDDGRVLKREMCAEPVLGVWKWNGKMWWEQTPSHRCGWIIISYIQMMELKDSPTRYRPCFWVVFFPRVFIFQLLIILIGI